MNRDLRLSVAALGLSCLVSTTACSSSSADDATPAEASLSATASSDGQTDTSTPKNTTGRPLCRSLVGQPTERALRVRSVPRDIRDANNLTCSLALTPKTNTPELVFMFCPGSTKPDLATFHNILYVGDDIDDGEYYGRLNGGTLYRLEPADPTIHNFEDVAAKVC